MKIFCPMCHHQNMISDEDVTANLFSIQCEKCVQLLSVKIIVEALQVVQTGTAAQATSGKNKVSDYIRAHFDDLNLPVLPILAGKIREAKLKPNCSISDIVDLVKTDQIIASKILELANSAAYGGLVEITDLKRAIIKLGLGTTEMLVHALENKRIYSSDNQHVVKLLKELWLHALGVALASQTIARDLEMDDESTVFSAGLLHDFGYILFIQALIQATEFKVDLTALNVDDFMEIAFPEHAQLGAQYLKQKGLPQTIVTIVACHEEIPPEEAENKQLHVVSLANLLCKKVGLGPVHDDSIRLDLTESAQTLRLNELKLADLEVKCEDLVKKVAAALE